MGRPLSRQQLFGANSNNNIKVQFHNGTASVRGYIVAQTGSKRFLCADEDGNQAVCYLKAKASGDLEAGEMSITILNDGEDAYQVTKISRHRVSYNGTSAPWTFAANLSDGKVQMEEVGDDDSFTNAVDLEGDDIPAGLFDKPTPGSGTFDATLAGANTASAGTPYDPGAGTASITNATLGLWRKKYSGNFGTNPGSGIDVTFVRNNPGFFGKPDTYVSFGGQNDPTESYYTFEWVGYFKAPSSGNYNFYVTCDDDTYMWIGTNALGTANTSSNMHLSSSNSPVKNANSVTLVGGNYYPVRIQFGEYGGAEEMQIYYAKVGDANAVAGNDGTTGTQVWYHNGTTKGH